MGGTASVIDKIKALTVNDLRSGLDDDIIDKLKRDAGNGDSCAANLLAYCTADGEAASWLLKAAKLGNDDAMYEYGYRLMHGIKIKKDREAGLKWLKKGAETRCVDAMFEYAKYTGSSEEKLKWLKTAAGSGHVGAMVRYGANCPDRALGAKWLKKAAELGNPEAMNLYGIRCGGGDGVAQNKNEAAGWYKKAAGLGEKQQ